MGASVSSARVMDSPRRFLVALWGAHSHERTVDGASGSTRSSGSGPNLSFPSVHTCNQKQSWSAMFSLLPQTKRSCS